MSMSTGVAWLDVTIALSAGITAIIMAWVTVYRHVVRPLFEIRDQFRSFIEDWNGEGDTPSVPARIESLEEKVEAVSYQVHPNGSGSLADSIHRTEAKIDRHINDADIEQRKIHARLDLLKQEGNEP